MSLVLASGSLSRREMLSAAGLAFEIQPAEVDERAIEAGLADPSPQAAALALAEAKALAVSRLRPGALVLGSDSLIEVEGRRFNKPASRDDAAAHLRFFSGKAMALHSAAALARDGVIEWRCGELATLKVRDLSESFIEAYLRAEWPAVVGCVGVFRIEAMGVQLFERIDGSHFTVLGMPLLPVLAALRAQAELAS